MGHTDILYRSTDHWNNHLDDQASGKNEKQPENNAFHFCRPVDSWFDMLYCIDSFCKQGFQDHQYIHEQEVALANPAVNKLEITSNSPDKKLSQDTLV